jgi:2-Cys peroxiredoxin 5
MSELKGKRLPDIALKHGDPHNFKSLHELKGINIIVGVPGAFTPPCSSHIPSYLEESEALAAAGVSGVYIVPVNDFFVVKAWQKVLNEKVSKELEAEGRTIKPDFVHFFPDDDARWNGQLGLTTEDAKPLLGQLRAKRYFLITRDAEVVDAVVEVKPTEFGETTADKVLEALKRLN